MGFYLTWGFNPHYGPEGGVQSCSFWAASQEQARNVAIEQFGENFGLGNAQNSERIIHTTEITVQRSVV